MMEYSVALVVLLVAVLFREYHRSVTDSTNHYIELISWYRQQLNRSYDMLDKEHDRHEKLYERSHIKE